MSDSIQIPQPSTPIGILGCVGGLFIHLVIGSLYQWGIVSIYITSYYHYYDQSVILESTAIAFPLMMFCIGVTMRLGLFFSEKFNPLVVSISGQILCSLTILISSFMPNVWLFILFYGILFGLCAGLNFMVPIYECNKYLVGKKMYVNGLILVGTGCGPIVFGLFSYNYLNPNKIPPIDGYYNGEQSLQQIAFKIPMLLKWLALMYLCVGLLGTLMLTPVYLHNIKVHNKQKQKKEQESAQQTKRLQEAKNAILELPNQQPIHHHQNSTTLIKTQQEIKLNETTNCFKTSKPEPVLLVETINIIKQDEQPKPIADSIWVALKSRVFWVMIAMLFVSSCGSFLLNGNYKTYVKKTIRDDNFLTIIGVIGCVGNGCSRFFWSLYYSKTGFKTALLTIMLIQIIVFSTIRFTTSNQGIYVIEIFLSNCCIGGYLVATPTAAQNIYGQATGTNIYGIYWCNFALANFLGYIYVSNLTKIIGFDNVVYICLGMTIVVIPVIIFTTFQGPWGNPTHQVEFCIDRELNNKVGEISKQQFPLQQLPKAILSTQVIPIVNQSPKKQLPKLPPINHKPLQQKEENQSTPNYQIVLKSKNVVE